MSGTVLITTCIENNRDWVVPVEKGPWKRIVLNIFSNALKYTTSGHINIALELVTKTDAPRYLSFSVTDTGIGMSPEFLKYHLFAPFVQENNLSSGTGLGLNIVKNIVESMRGKVVVESQLHEGTRVTVNVPLDHMRHPTSQAGAGESSVQHNQLQGLSMGLLSIVSSDSILVKPELSIVSPPEVLLLSIRSICEVRFGMIVRDASKQTSLETEILLIDTHAFQTLDGLDSDLGPLKSVSRTTTRAIVLLGVPVHSITSLFGPELVSCLPSPITGRRVQAALLSALSKVTARKTTPSAVPSATTGASQYALADSNPTYIQGQYVRAPPDRSPDQGRFSLEVDSPEIARSPSTLHTRTTSRVLSDIDPTMTCQFKRLLLVDDNPINLKVLAAFANRMGLTFSTAADGAEAVSLYRRAAVEETPPFDCIFMDISMPIMDGFQAVKAIRHFETQLQQRLGVCEMKSNDAESDTGFRSYILALTGLGSESARASARSSGFDKYLLKPIKFKDVAPLLRTIPVD